MSDERPPLPPNSDAWRSHLRPWVNRRLEHLRDELERDGIPVEQTRGRIAELREMMRKIEPDLPAEGSAGAYFPPANSAT